MFMETSPARVSCLLTLVTTPVLCSTSKARLLMPVPEQQLRQSVRDSAALERIIDAFLSAADPSSAKTEPADVFYEIAKLKVAYTAWRSGNAAPTATARTGPSTAVPAAETSAESMTDSLPAPSTAPEPLVPFLSGCLASLAAAALGEPAPAGGRIALPDVSSPAFPCPALAEPLLLPLPGTSPSLAVPAPALATLLASSGVLQRPLLPSARPSNRKEVLCAVHAPAQLAGAARRAAAAAAESAAGAAAAAATGAAGTSSATGRGDATDEEVIAFITSRLPTVTLPTVSSSASAGEHASEATTLVSAWSVALGERVSALLDSLSADKSEAGNDDDDSAAVATARTLARAFALHLSLVAEPEGCLAARPLPGSKLAGAVPKRRGALVMSVADDAAAFIAAASTPTTSAAATATEGKYAARALAESSSPTEGSESPAFASATAPKRARTNAVSGEKPASKPLLWAGVAGSTAAPSSSSSSSSASSGSSSAVVPHSRHCVDPASWPLAPQRYLLDTIGYLDSCFRLKYGTPRQGTVVPSSRASLVLHAPLTADCVAGLEEYSHVWVVFIFHSNAQKRYHPKVQPPRLGGVKVGCLASRTPHRWNDIGLSVVKLESIDYAAPDGSAGIKVLRTTKAGVQVRSVPGPFHLHTPYPSIPAAAAEAAAAGHPAPLPGCVRLNFSGVDLVDGTPVLDVKPYHPSDAVPSEKLTLPHWLATAPLAALQVTVSARARRQLEEIFYEHYRAAVAAADGTKKKIDVGANYASALAAAATATAGADADAEAAAAACWGSPLQFYATVSEAQRAMEQVLSMDPRPLCTKRRHEDGIYGFVLDRINVIYTMTGDKTAEIAMVEHRPASAAAAAAAFVGADHAAAAATTTTAAAAAAGEAETVVAGGMNKDAWLAAVRARLQEDD